MSGADAMCTEVCKEQGVNFAAVGAMINRHDLFP